MQYTKEAIKEQLISKISRYFAVTPAEATAEQIYKATVLSVRDILAAKYNKFSKDTKTKKKKRVYYLCMEFLLGPSLKMNLFNLGLLEKFGSVISEMGFDINDICAMEADPGLGNGGLGRLAACFMDSLASLEYPARGFSLCYEYGLFKQKIVDGEQLELPDIWLPSGEAWLVPRQDRSVRVRLGGKINEEWKNDHLEITYTDYDEIEAVPYDMFISGYKSSAVTPLRLWKAKGVKDFNMEAFSQGQYLKAVEANTIAETLTRVLYPADNHHEGKLLRLSQQYFLVSASLQNILLSHIEQYKTLDNLASKVAIHINDTHPALAIPELMRLLMDVHRYSWEDAWKITVNTISYTNHTVLPEALECWNEDLFRLKLPRIYNIINEINRRFCAEAWEIFPGNWDKISRMSIIGNGQVKMANLSVVGSHTVNGVSALHSDILKETVFRDFNDAFPGKLTNVTNGITHRRWLCLSNPRLASLLDECIGDEYRLKPEKLENFASFSENKTVLKRLSEIKLANKKDFAAFIKKTTGETINPESIFDVQVKRLHEYKRQLMNALYITSLYIKLKQNPSLDIQPHTFIFGAKAAPGYYQAKDIIRYICYLAADINRNPATKDKLKVIFLENYCVSLAEKLIPAAEISEQISLAGKEASGTSNMKFMINGALTIGTLDGANVEMAEAVGMDNIFIFGHTASEVDELWKKGYASSYYYNSNQDLKAAIDSLQTGYNGRSFNDIASYLLYSYGVSDPFMCLADYAYFAEAHKKADEKYKNQAEWNKSAVINIAKAGRFSSDRSINEYAANIWGLKK